MQVSSQNRNGKHKLHDAGNLRITFMFSSFPMMVHLQELGIFTHVKAKQK